jgi:Matrixin.
MNGEVQDIFDQAVTKPLPIKAEAAMGRFWADMCLPLEVFYSPLLRLRYRSALSSCINQINLACHRVVLNAPQEASNRLAIELEHHSIAPPLGIIYVKDCEDRKAIEGNVQFYQDDKHVLCGAVVRLPESEDGQGPCLTLGVTLHEVGHLLGLVHSDDPGSIMFPIAKIRPQLLPDRDVDTLRRIYNNNL